MKRFIEGEDRLRSPCCRSASRSWRLPMVGLEPECPGPDLKEWSSEGSHCQNGLHVPLLNRLPRRATTKTTVGSLQECQHFPSTRCVKRLDDRPNPKQVIAVELPAWQAY